MAAGGNTGTGGGSGSGAGSGSGQGGGTGQPATQRGKVTSKFLNVRKGPGTSNAKVAELHQGDIVNLLEKTSGFWKIAQGQYVSADFIQVIASNGAPAPAVRKGKVTSTFLECADRTRYQQRKKWGS